jgi:L-seryl-tRNA(Ser) seleniumtransferase
MLTDEGLVSNRQELLRKLPPVHEVLSHAELADLRASRGRDILLAAVRRVIAQARHVMENGGVMPIDAARLAKLTRAAILTSRPLLRPVINATGILLHTGLGRAPLAREAVEAMSAVAGGYCNLEFDLDTGDRGRRTAGISRLLGELTGAKAATVVNNNAGATLLALRALAAGREVIVSRGQLVAIGGSFRLPEIFEASGARLREVGTTNRTRLADYQKAIGPDTAAILRVHRSNFRIVGFTEDTALGDLAALAHAHGLVMIDDIGSGALAPGFPPGLVDEPDVSGGLAAGADLVLFSGDKLLGGPQCGILIGKAEVIRQIEIDPLMRALRVDKMTLAALEATVDLIRGGAGVADRIPLWKMLSIPLSDLELRAGRLVATLAAESALNVSMVSAESFLGGGSVPLQPIPTWAVRVAPPFPRAHGSEGAWARTLRLGDPAVVTRVQHGTVLFDLRTVTEPEESSLLDAIRRTWDDREPATGASEGLTG